MLRTINLSGKIFSLQKPSIMGIINITPDSFHKDSRFNPFDEKFLLKANEMIENGLDIFDIGGYSTRPGAKNISINEEIDRIMPAIEFLKRNFPETPISIDTFRSSVAEAALNSGASLINDISAGKFDIYMFDVIKKYQIPYILMHSRGDLESMHSTQNYKNVLTETLFELLETANLLKKQGLNDIILDPGFGFSKSLDLNYTLLSNIKIFTEFNFPVLMGISRKSMIYKLLNIDIKETLPATSSLNLFGLLKNIALIRVHDVKEAVEIRKILNKLENRTV